MYSSVSAKPQKLTFKTQSGHLQKSDPGPLFALCHLSLTLLSHVCMHCIIIGFMGEEACRKGWQCR